MSNSAISFNTAGLASATSPGLVGTGAQTFAGDKTLSGLLSANGGILNTGLTGANATAATAGGSGKVGETIGTGVGTTTLNSNGSSTTLATFTITRGVWLLSYSLNGRITIGSDPNGYIAGSIIFQRNGVQLSGTQQELASDENSATVVLGTRVPMSLIYFHVETAASSTITTIMSMALAGTGTFQINPNGVNNGNIYAIRIA